MKNNAAAFDTIRELTKNNRVLQFLKLRIRRRTGTDSKVIHLIVPFIQQGINLAKLIT